MLNGVPEAESPTTWGRAPRADRRPRGWRNGPDKRSLTTRVETPELRVPRDPEGTFRTKLFHRYQRSEKALVLVLMEMVVNGVSTRKVRRINDELCGREFSRSTVSELAKVLDGQVEAWHERPLEGTRYPFLIADAMYVKVRRGGGSGHQRAARDRGQRGRLPGDPGPSDRQLRNPAGSAGELPPAESQEPGGGG